MKNKSIIFIVVCMALCLIPSIGMIFFPTTQTTENRAMAKPPMLITEDNTINRNFFGDFEDYFNEHAALRNQMIYSDAIIQNTLFRESNVSGVITGTDGWLYYSSTLNDYLGIGVMSDRMLFNLANNFSVVQEYLNERDIKFTLTIPPNKNTLYGENMPYYKSHTVNQEHSAELLAPYLAEQNISYIDLFELFKNEEERMYLLRDSHWNMKGACLAYNAVMDSLQIIHNDYSDKEPVIVNDENGDLNKMLYSFYGEPEENYSYDILQNYVYANNAGDVEAGWIITENEGGSGTLLMFRDSFANTLIPFMSNEFQTAYYSKGQPNAIERYVEMYSPDYVVIEKVERNISEYLNNPPILMPEECELPVSINIAETETTVFVEECINDVNYYKISGTADSKRIKTNSQILVSVGGKVYPAYQTEECGYCIYIKKSAFDNDTADIQVYIVNGYSCVRAISESITLPE